MKEIVEALMFKDVVLIWEVGSGRYRQAIMVVFKKKKSKQLYSFIVNAFKKKKCLKTEEC